MVVETHCSLTGLITYVGSTPIILFSRKQGASTKSTYAAEFAVLCTATEEIISLRYMLWYLGRNVPACGSCPTKTSGKIFSVIQSVANPIAYVSKKHVTISYHSVREAIAECILKPY